MDVKFIPSTENKADLLTRVPKKWLNSEREHLVCGAADTVTPEEVNNIHETCGHPGIRRTLYFCKRLYPSVQRHQVRDVVQKCRQCQAIDPAPEKWQRGELSVPKIWSRVSMDICHVNHKHYLTLIDCGPSRYAIWRNIRRQDTASVIEQLESVFLERGAPEELLTDNATSFRSSLFTQFAERWGMSLRYRCANAPSGNGISERCHRTVKTIQARTGCPVAQAVYRYNVMPRGNDAASAPANQIFKYEVRLLGIDGMRLQQPSNGQHRYSVGDRVWVRHPSRRCNSTSLQGTVTKIVSAQNVEVDGMPRHIRDLRLMTLQQPLAQEEGQHARKPDLRNEEGPLLIQVRTPGVEPDGDETTEEEEEGNGSQEGPQFRRSTRERRPTWPCQYCDL